MKYTFKHGNYEIVAYFQTIKELSVFLKIVPEHELKHSIVLKHTKNGAPRVGRFIRDNKLVIF